MVVNKFWPVYYNFSLDFYKLSYVNTVTVSFMKGAVVKAISAY